MTLHEFRVPDIGEGLADVEIVEWRVKVGDDVSEHQILAAVETDKSVIEVPSPYTGVIRTVNGAPGDRVPVGAVLVVIEGDGPAVLMEDSPREAPPVPAGASSTGSPAPVPGLVAVSPSAGPGRGRASPAVRRLARELGVTLGDVTGSGAGGLVLADDVRAAASGSSDAGGSAAPTSVGASPGPVRHEGREPERVALRGLRRTVAQNMAAVVRVPHITSHREVPATELLAWRAKVNEGRERPITITPFLALCVMGALRAVPKLNAVFDEDALELTVHRAVHLGIAAATDDGLLVPVVHDADLLRLEDLARAIESKAERARARTLAPAEMTGGTFTITNYGANDGWFGTPLLRLPEIGIAGFGRIEERPWVVDGALAVVPILPMSVSVDHRVIDGDVSGQFTKALTSYLTDPMRLLAVGSAWS